MAVVALKRLNAIFPDVNVSKSMESVAWKVFQLSPMQAVIIFEEALNLIARKKYTEASFAALAMAAVAGKRSCDWGGGDEAVRIFMAASAINQMAVERKKIAARLKKKPLGNLAVDVTKLRTMLAIVGKK